MYVILSNLKILIYLDPCAHLSCLLLSRVTHYSARILLCLATKAMVSCLCVVEVKQVRGTTVMVRGSAWGAGSRGSIPNHVTPKT